MKSLLAILITLKTFYSMKFHHHEQENFFYLKCFIYLLLSSIHSTIIKVTIPLGAIIMFIFSIFDHKNRKLKLKMIGVGLIVVFLSIINYQLIATPIQKAYLYFQTYNTDTIEVFAHNNSHETFLFSITDPVEIDKWIKQLEFAEPITSWQHKSLETDMGYTLKLNSENHSSEILLSPYSDFYANMYVGNFQFSYYNSSIIEFIDEIYSRKPSILTINTSKQSSINITNTNLLTTLWRSILWSEYHTYDEASEQLFNIPGYLFFDKYLGCRISFSDDFRLAYIDKKGIIELPPYLQTLLNEQFILSQLDYVDKFTEYKAAHLHTPQSTSEKFSISLDPNALYHGLYRHDFRTNEMTLLHTVYSSSAEYFILKHPYILLLDEKSPNEYYLMLVNQNIPEKHRYISKNQDILPQSISICPQNSKFTYIISHGDTSTLYLATDYYRSPVAIATGNISDSLFLSDDLIVFSQELNGKNLLCVYSITYSQIIKYISIPGDIILTKSEDQKVYFAVQSIEGLTLKESEFFLTDDLEIQKVLSTH